MQVGEPLNLHRRHALVAGARTRRDELLALVRMSRRRSACVAYPHQFSGGMRQRAMIAMALACEPQPDHRRRADDRARRDRAGADPGAARRAGTREPDSALILITHDLGVVARYADRVVRHVRRARSSKRRPRAELYAHPRHPYTLRAAGLGAAPRRRRRAQRLMPIEGQPPDLARLPPGCAFAPRCTLASERCRTRAPGALRRAGSRPP